MTPRKFTEVALKILGLYGLLESVVAISRGISFYGFWGVFSKIEYSISHVLPAIILLTFGWILLQFSQQIVNKIFDRGEPLPPSLDRSFREWHISLLSPSGGFLTVWGIPILLSSMSNSLALLSMDVSQHEAFTGDSLLRPLVFFGGVTIVEFGICMVLLFGAKPVSEYILKLQDSHIA